MNVILDTEATDKDIKVVLFQMHPNKAPDSDGTFMLYFLKKFGILSVVILSCL